MRAISKGSLAVCLVHLDASSTPCSISHIKDLSSRNFYLLLKAFVLETSTSYRTDVFLLGLSLLCV